MHLEYDLYNFYTNENFLFVKQVHLEHLEHLIIKRDIFKITLFYNLHFYLIMLFIIYFHIPITFKIVIM